MRKINLSGGEAAIVKNAMIDLDGTNIEEGVEIFVDGKWLNSFVGLFEHEVTEEMIYLMME